MKILDRVPIGHEPETITVGAEAVTIKRFQIFVWASIQSSPPFPAILDTSHSHNFSITESQLAHWTGLRSRQLKLIGATLLTIAVSDEAAAIAPAFAISLPIPYHPPMTDPATTLATQLDVASILERVGSLGVSVTDQMQSFKADLSRSFDLAIEIIRHDLVGANSDRIAGLENRVGAIERHVGL
jgi:hypothetical protein